MPTIKKGFHPLYAQIEKDDLIWLRVRAAQTEVKVIDLVRRAIAEFRARHDKKGK